jgi:mono/diheme cytochrome c family protein
MTDGAHVTRYKTQARAIAANGEAVALADGGAVRLFTGDKQSEVALAGVELVAFDGAGVLMAATAHALYRVNASSVAKVYDAGARTIHGLVGAGSNVWFVVGGDLGRWHEGQVALATGGTLAPDARLVGSASGDVWVVSNGQLVRSSGGAGATSPDEAMWTSAVEPIHAAVCSKCHSPAGSGLDSSRIDLSTYSAWSARKASIYRRVVTNAATPAQMPPESSGFPLTDAQRAAIEAWSKP